MEWYPWIVLIHVAGGFGFVLGHGASVMVAFRLRSERDPARVSALLDLSSGSLGMMYGALLVLLIAGIAAGFVGGYWGQAWIWVALGVFIVIVVAMYPLGSQHYAKVRRAFGLKTYQDKADAPAPEPASSAEQAALLASPQPWILAILGGGGLLIILWLMVVKPF
jgi:hypothetical protein